MCRKRLRVKRHKQKNNNRWVSANDFLASDPIDETRQGIQSHFQATLDQLELLFTMDYNFTMEMNDWEKRNGHCGKEYY